MSSLLDLPTEILIIIIKKLDIKSVYNLYKTCGTMKSIILLQGVIRICNLSCNTLATPKSLQLDMIKHISGQLYELNMCGVVNLRKSILLPALTRMKCLKTLDVSCTEISIFDMLDLFKNCPNIKNLSINFPDVLKLTETTLHECQEVFKNFINVHFVVRTRMSNLPLHILQKSSLDTLKFTLCGVGGSMFEWGDIDLTCLYKHFCIFMVNYGPFNAYQGFWKELLPLVKIEDIEFIILEYNATYSICTSPLFKVFFSENFKITSFLNFDMNKIMYGTVAIFIWNNKTTIFDESFFISLKKRIKEILSCELKVTSEQTMPLSIDTNCYDWFDIYPIKEDGHGSRRADTEPDFKKRRIVQSYQVMNYDKMFHEHNYVKLSVYISSSINVTLSSSSDYLRKLTYLSLAGPLVRYSNEFFNILFRCCKRLVTLNVEASSLSSCCSSIIRSIPLSQSVKNLRLVDKRIDFKTLFSSFTQCKTLENICVIDSSTKFNDIADLMTLYQCINLYSLHIQAEMKKSTVIKMNAMNKALLKKHSDHYINFVLEYCTPHSPFDYNPYLNVFNLKPIKPV